MKRKAQAAMEFLMTYGWAILVVLAAVGILAYLGLFDQSKRTPPRCEVWPTGQGLECIEDADALVSAGTITFPVRNQHNYAVTGITFVNSTTCRNITSSVDPVPTNTITQLTLTNCTLSPNTRYDEEFTIVYTSGTSGANHSSTGKVGGLPR